jgi:hypothetical protein
MTTTTISENEVLAWLTDDSDSNPPGGYEWQAADEGGEYPNEQCGGYLSINRSGCLQFNSIDDRTGLRVTVGNSPFGLRFHWTFIESPSDLLYAEYVDF